MLRQPYLCDMIIFMKAQERTLELQDGTVLTIRSLAADDAIPTIGLMKRIYGESVFLARYPGTSSRSRPKKRVHSSEEGLKTHRRCSSVHSWTA